MAKRKQTASLKIDIWTDRKEGLPEDLAEAFAPHVEHVQKLCEEGYLSGQIVDEAFSGWWNIERRG